MRSYLSTNLTETCCILFVCAAAIRLWWRSRSVSATLIMAGAVCISINTGVVLLYRYQLEMSGTGPGPSGPYWAWVGVIAGYLKACGLASLGLGIWSLRVPAGPAGFEILPAQRIDEATLHP